MNIMSFDAKMIFYCFYAQKCIAKNVKSSKVLASG